MKRCCRSDWPELCLFCCSQPSCVLTELIWASFFFCLFHKFPAYLLQPPPGGIAMITPAMLLNKNLKKPGSRAEPKPSGRGVYIIS